VCSPAFKGVAVEQAAHRTSASPVQAVGDKLLGEVTAGGRHSAWRALHAHRRSSDSQPVGGTVAFQLNHALSRAAVMMTSWASDSASTTTDPL